MTHVHEWRFVSHLDGCHYFSTSAVCGCGATQVQSAERDMADDLNSAMWADDDSCERCRELLAGAAPDAPREEVVMPR
jgi:hypothetical protein